MAQSNLGKAYVQIVPSAKGISGSVTGVLKGESEAAGKAAGSNITGFIKKTIIAAGIGKLLKDTIQEGARYEQGRGGIETLFGAKGAKNVQEYAKMVGKSVADVSGEYGRLKSVEDRMMKNANDAWKTAGLSANEYMEQSTSFAASLLQSVGGNQAKAAQAANQAVIDMSDNANKMGTDIQDIQNAYQGFAKQNYTMLDNLKLGYGGTKTEMERLLTDAEKLSGKKYDINNLSDVYEAIHVVQGELSITGTTAKEAEGTLSGSFASMKAAASNFMAQLVNGEDVKGALSGLIDSAGTFLFDNLIPAIGNVITNIPWTDMFSRVSSKFEELANDPELPAKGAKMLESFIGGIVEAIPSLLEAADNVFRVVLNVAAGVIGDLAQKGMQAISGWAKGVWGGFQSGAASVIDRIKASVSGKFESIKTVIAGKASAAVNAIKSKFAEAQSAILRPVEIARDKVKGVVDHIKSFFSFQVSMPHIPLPHFSVTPSGWKVGDLLKGSIPHLGISWYAEGGIMNRPTLFGGGEAGPEGIIPLDPFWKRIDNMTKLVAQEKKAGGGDQIINLYYDSSDEAKDMVRDIGRGMKRMKMAGVI